MKLSFGILFLFVAALASAENYACTGTEPFWSINISEADHKIHYFSPEHPEGIAYKYVGPYSAAGMESTFVQVFRGTKGPSPRPTVTLIKNATCSDGMSDTVYAYEVVVYNGKTKVLYGCCNNAGK